MNEEELRKYKCEVAKRSYWNNRDKILKRNKTKKVREYKARWSRLARKANPEKFKAANNKSWRNKRAQWIAENGPCRKCGSWNRLEVDHKDPGKKKTHNVWTWSQERREIELKKCWVLCFICHRLKTNKERGWKMHGILNYMRGCRCNECGKAFEKREKRIKWYGKP